MIEDEKLPCPHCQSQAVDIVESKDIEDVVQRKYKCRACKGFFYCVASQKFQYVDEGHLIHTLGVKYGRVPLPVKKSLSDGTVKHLRESLCR
jgi:hypothetical protein